MSRTFSKLIALSLSVSYVIYNIAALDVSYADDEFLQDNYNETEIIAESSDEEMELDVIIDGSVTDTITYELKNNTLTIRGSGEMPQYNDVNTVKWYAYRTAIKQIIIEEGITFIGKNTFLNISDAYVAIPSSMSKIDYKAFVACSGLNVDILSPSTRVDANAFYNCEGISVIQPTPEPTEVPVPDELSFSNIKADASNYAATVYGGCDLIYGNILPRAEYKIYCEYWSQKNPDKKLRTTGKTIDEGNKEYSDSLTMLQPNTVYYYRFGDGISNWAEPILSFKTGIPVSGNTNGIGWQIDKKTGILSINSVEGMYRYDSAQSNPWHDYGYDDIIKKIVFTKDVKGTHILGAYLFSDLKNLEEVEFAKGLVNIEAHAFEGCLKLKNVEFPSGLISIGEQAFYGCESMDKIDIPEKTEIGKNAFSNCLAVKNVNIPSLRGAVLSDYFANCDNIKSVEIFGKDEELADSAFANSNVEKVYIDGLKSIGESAFYGCSKLRIFKIADGVEEIPAKAFKKCESLKSLRLPQSVTKIGEAAFEECSSLETINIPTGIEYINNYTFRNCSKLSALIIPNTVIGVGDEVLKGCNELYSLRIPFVGKSHDDLDTWAKDNVFGYLFGYTTTPGDGLTYQFRDENNVKYYYYIPESLKTVEVDNIRPNSDNSDTVIPKYAFVNCASLKHITIDGGKTVFEGAFKNCVSLKSLFLPTSVETIHKDILYNCQSVESLNVPFVGSSRNDNENATSTLGYFWGSSEKQIGLDTEQYYSQGKHSFYHIPITLRDVIISNETDLPFGAFMNCSSIRTVVLGRTGKIDKFSFYNCQQLKDVTLAADLEEIGYESFANCKRLKTVNVPKSCTKLGSRVFYGDDMLESVYIPATTNVFEDDVNGAKGGQDGEYKNNLTINSDLELSAANNIKWCVVKGSDAENIAKANDIPYEYVASSEFEVKFTTTTHLGDGVFSIVDNTVTGKNRNTGRVYVAIYDYSGRCLAGTVTEADGSGTYSATITNKKAIKKMHHAYVYFWNEGMCPVLSAEYLDNAALHKEDTKPNLDNANLNVIDEND